MDLDNHTEILNDIENFVIFLTTLFVLDVGVDGGEVLHPDVVEVDVVDVVHLRDFVGFVENGLVGLHFEVAEVEDPASGEDVVVLVKR